MRLNSVSFDNYFFLTVVAALSGYLAGRIVRWLCAPSKEMQQAKNDRDNFRQDELFRRTYMNPAEWSRLNKELSETPREEHIYFCIAYGDRIDQKWPKFILDAARESL